MKDLYCKKAKKLAVDYLQDLLAPDLVEGIERHLSACPSCQREYQDTRKVLTLLRRDRMTDPGPDFWKGLHSHMMAQIRPGRSKPEKVPWYKRVWENPFGWSGYAWVTALILICLTPAVIYNNYFRNYGAPVVQETMENEWKSEMGHESFFSAFEALSPQESLRLGEKITARLAKDLPVQTHGLVEDELQWDVSPVLESLTPQELDALIKKTRPGNTAGFEEGLRYVS